MVLSIESVTILLRDCEGNVFDATIEAARVFVASLSPKMVVVPVKGVRSVKKPSVSSLTAKCLYPNIMCVVFKDKTSADGDDSPFKGKII